MNRFARPVLLGVMMLCHLLTAGCHNLWSPSDYIARLSQSIKADPQNDKLYFERGKWYFRCNEFGNSINDFNTVLTLNPDHNEAQQMREMVQEILEFRYKDIYNP